jgi:hypothetical protein
MPALRRYLSVGFCEGYMDADYEVSGIVCHLTYLEMQELRAMLPVAIASMERMWAEEQARKNPPAMAAPSPSDIEERK